MRQRAYIHHNARALSLPLMHEASLAFGAYFAATPLSQFRGSHMTPTEYEVNTIFMSTHYVIERHREALLWSWVVAKWGGPSGLIDKYDKRQMWHEIGGSDDDLLVVPRTKRPTADDVEVNMMMAGLQFPRSFDENKQADTIYSWSTSSMRLILLPTADRLALASLHGRLQLFVPRLPCGDLRQPERVHRRGN